MPPNDDAGRKADFVKVMLVGSSELSDKSMRGAYVVKLPEVFLVAVAEAALLRETPERDFRLEVVADRQVASCTLGPQAEGVLEVNLPFALEATTDHPIAIRLSTQRAAFGGIVAVVEASLTTDGAMLAET